MNLILAQMGNMNFELQTPESFALLLVMWDSSSSCVAVFDANAQTKLKYLGFTTVLNQRLLFGIVVSYLHRTYCKDIVALESVRRWSDLARFAKLCCSVQIPKQPNSVASISFGLVSYLSRTDGTIAVKSL